MFNIFDLQFTLTTFLSFHFRKLVVIHVNKFKNGMSRNSTNCILEKKTIEVKEAGNGSSFY